MQTIIHKADISACLLSQCLWQPSSPVPGLVSLVTSSWKANNYSQSRRLSLSLSVQTHDLPQLNPDFCPINNCSSCNILLISVTTIANCRTMANIYFALTFAQVTASGIKESAINFHTLLNNCRKMANARVLILPVLLISVLHTSELSLTMTSIQTMVRTD